MARALTASEATAILIKKGWFALQNNIKTLWIADNEYTKKYGESSFKWENPEHNHFNPSLAHWTATGVRFSITIYEWGGKSNITLEKWDGSCGKTIVSYNKLTAAEKKEFFAMCENATLLDYEPPFRVWEGWKDESYRDENGVFNSAWRTPNGILHNCRE